MASTGHSGSHSVQSIHSSGSNTRKFGPSWKQSTGHTSTQSIYLHLMQLSVTTNAMTYPSVSIEPGSILPQPQIGGPVRSRAQRPGQFGEMMRFAAGAAIREVAAQGELAAGKGQFG